MKDSMSNVDIRMILPEIIKVADKAFIKNIYQYGEVFVLKIYQPTEGTFQLLIEPGKRIHLSQFRRVAPRLPSRFITVLRKYLRDRRIISLKQHDLDRIVIIEVGDEESSHKLIAELFGRGNLLLLDPQDTIFVALNYKKMRDRDVIPKASYEFPPMRGKDVFELDDSEIENLLKASESNIVRTLTSKLNLDSLSCEEICARGGIPPTSRVSELEAADFDNLKQATADYQRDVRRGIHSPKLVFGPESDADSDALAFLPFPFQLYEEYPQKEFDTFSHCIDEYFGVTREEMARETTDDTLQKERTRLQRIVDKQQEAMQSLEKRARELRTTGELIYSNFAIVQEVLNTITQARSQGRSWNEIIETIESGRKAGNDTAQLIEEISPSEALVTVKLNDKSVDLDLRLSPQENGSKAYEQAKKAESKLEGARRQVEKTMTQLLELDESMVEPETAPEPIKIRKKNWYEKYRWFLSSEDYLVIAGRDAKTNEQLAKRQMGPNDIFLHAAIHGAPYTIIKVPEKQPSEQTIIEAAQFAITFSRAWEDRISSGDAYWVTPEQVSFSPPSGEYLPSGAVMIYGSKNYIRNVPVELAVGVILEDDYAIPVSGPISAIRSQTDYYVRIGPGGKKKGTLVKNIRDALEKKVPEQASFLVNRIRQEDLMRVLPPGDGHIENV